MAEDTREQASSWRHSGKALVVVRPSLLARVVMLFLGVMLWAIAIAVVNVGLQDGVVPYALLGLGAMMHLAAGLVLRNVARQGIRVWPDGGVEARGTFGRILFAPGEGQRVLIDPLGLGGVVVTAARPYLVETGGVAGGRRRRVLESTLSKASSYTIANVELPDRADYVSACVGAKRVDLSFRGFWTALVSPQVIGAVLLGQLVLLAALP